MTCDEAPFEELAQLEYRPNREELLRLCPSILDFFNCYFRGVKNCLGREVEEIAESGDGIASSIAKSLLSTRSLAVEMCDEYSTLHKNYLENVECFESLVVEDSPVCTQKGGMYADAFLRHFHNLENENLDWEELYCLERLYALACFAEQVEMTCGEVARKTFLNILEKVRGATFVECDIENPLSLKRSFFDFLELGGKRSELYRSVFQTFRKR
ncbi:uncharacterized protein LOC129984041 isoform X2 [Argiope bruennichi]|nr:uncharacterized protein LOC129984041 isoform X2 [Argiope bruennichi]